MAEKKEQPIIIRKIIEDEDHGHHGGAWKIAYADLMTAMMAFFLMMWLLAAADEAQLEALADYFTPTIAKRDAPIQGGAGIMWGESPSAAGVQGENDETEGNPDEVKNPPEDVNENVVQPLSVSTGFPDGRVNVTALHPDEMPLFEDYENFEDMDISEAEALRELRDQIAESFGENFGIETGEIADMMLLSARLQEEIERRMEAQVARNQYLSTIESQIKNAVIASSNTPDLLENMEFQIVEEGLLIQILDRDGKPIFDLGSAVLGQNARQLVIAVAQAVSDIEYDLVISGHTDSLPYRGGANYTNWELSADRANSTRRLLEQNGVSETRIARVAGFADTDPLLTEDTQAAENRRVNILLRFPDPMLETLNLSDIQE